MDRQVKQTTYTFKEHGHLWRDTDELLAPEIILGVPKQLNESDQRAPRVGAMHDKSLQQNLRHDFSEAVVLDFQE
jgi:hypothetical protein